MAIATLFCATGRWLLLLNTGLRVGELLALQLEDLTLSERKGSLYVREGKGGKSRSVPLNTVARKALRDYLATRPEGQGGAIFLGRQGPIGERTVQRLLKKYIRQAGLNAAQVNAHTLRHTFCKNLVDAGVPLERVAMLLGYANLNPLRVYTTPDESDLPQDVERIINL